MDNECKGCLTYGDREGCSIHCEVPPSLSSTQKCPCGTCLIKGVCVVSCDEFHIYTKQAKGYIGKRYK